MGRAPAVVLIIALAGLASTAFSAEVPVADQPNKYVEPTHEGRVVGRVYDASTGQPLPNAQMSVEDSGTFPTTGKSTGVTDETGRYSCAARIGRISRSFNLGRALGSGIFGLLSGSATDKTMRIDVSRLNIKASCSGYETFEGIVPVRDVDAGAFAAEMHPILMTKSGSGEVPTPAPGWGAAGIMDVTVSPAIAEPGSKVTVTIKVKCPRAAATKKTSVELTSTGFAHKWLREPAYQDGVAVFSTEYQISRKLKPGSELVRVRLHDCLAEIMPGGDCATALFQVVKTPEEVSAADLRAKAFDLWQLGSNTEALATAKDLCKSPVAGVKDYIALATIAEQVGDYAAATDAWTRVVELTPKKEQMPSTARKACSMLKAGRASQVISEFAPLISSTKEKDRPKRLPLALMTALGFAHLEANNLEKAADVARQIVKWQGAATDRMAIDFQTATKLRQFDQRIAAEPDNAQNWADYGRFLLDAGRYEEALDKLSRADSIDPSISALQADMQFAMSRLLGKQTEQTQDLDALIQAAEARLGPKKDSQDFYSWHNYALLLLRKLYRDGAPAEPAAPAVTACRAALVSSLLCGRSSKDVIRESSYTALGYMGESVVGIEGFAYPEANTDFLILRSLRTVAADPHNKLAHLNLAVGFLELKENDLASSAIRSCGENGVACNDLVFCKALLAMQTGNTAEAKSLLQEVLKSNPRHPRANKLLAEICAQAGDQTAALSCLAAHASCYTKLRMALEW